MLIKNKIIFLFIFLFSFLIIGNSVSASTTDGTIDPAFRYAWGENVGWVDFGSTAGNVHITDSALSGFVYGENIGWIDLSTITNNNEGTLSGHAWGENVGWVDFLNVTIGSDGVFAGSAYGENIGWITFGTGDNKVATDWRPASSRDDGGGSQSHASGSRRSVPIFTPTPVIPPNVVCKPGDRFSSATGLPCTSSAVPTVCPTGHLFSATNGLPCTQNQSLQLGTGQASPTTFPFTQCTISLTLRQGSRGNEVKCLQTRLNILSDGIFGPITKSTVVLFQTANSLVPDGIVGPITRAKLLNN